MGGFVMEAQEAVVAKVKLPPGYYLTWGGQFENQQRAQATLMIVVPLCLGLIFILLFMSFNSVKNALLIIMNVPFALIGGIFALAVSGQYLSVPSSVGFIALFGVAVLNGVVMVSYFKAPLNEDMDSLRLRRTEEKVEGQGIAWFTKEEIQHLSMRAEDRTALNFFFANLPD